jgi:hypothetical protein
MLARIKDPSSKTYGYTFRLLRVKEVTGRQCRASSPTAGGLRPETWDTCNNPHTFSRCSEGKGRVQDFRDLIRVNESICVSVASL